MRALQTILFLLLSIPVWSQLNNDAKIIINGQEVDFKLMPMISPKNIKKIDIIKTTNPPELRITTKKKIEYLDYNALKKRTKINKSENLPVVVDFDKIENVSTMLIDKDLIRKIRVENGIINIRTPRYRNEKKEQGKPKIMIR